MQQAKDNAMQALHAAEQRREQASLGAAAGSMPLVDDALASDLLDLVELMASYYEEPCNWPLSAEEQSMCARRLLIHARKIKDTEPFMRALLVRATRRASNSELSDSASEGARRSREP